MNLHELAIARAMSGIKGFPTVHGHGMHKDQPFIIFQKLGHTLNELMSKNKKHFSIKTVMTIGACLIDQLKKFHEEGYVHCDIKPDNIMIGDFKNEFSEMN